ncbi:uncharacterized protein HaLaN_26688 [Haematococcus lacustris]|uniref:Uncharacterized protein n=1 Tax=Haematococcus lacustris TaxID=44745 RepID=A0A6A0A6Y4_HAELA|nr:uncharacterized protein HaLaN_26688 [Haematococcus lacustris]
MPEPDDGWGPVLAAARQGSLALRALHQARQYKQALALAMQQMAQAAGTGLLEEPELILVYSAGPVSLYGYAPFHARAAEFVAMGPCLVPPKASNDRIVEMAGPPVDVRPRVRL